MNRTECPYCGEKIEQNARKCPWCDERLDDYEELLNSHYKVGSHDGNEHVGKKSSRVLYKYVSFSVIAVFLVLVTWGIVYYLDESPYYRKHIDVFNIKGDVASIDQGAYRIKYNRRKDKNDISPLQKGEWTDIIKIYWLAYANDLIPFNTDIEMSFDDNNYISSFTIGEYRYEYVFDKYGKWISKRKGNEEAEVIEYRRNGQAKIWGVPISNYYCEFEKHIYDNEVTWHAGEKSGVNLVYYDNNVVKKREEYEDYSAGITYIYQSDTKLYSSTFYLPEAQFDDDCDCIPDKYLATATYYYDNDFVSQIEITTGETYLFTRNDYGDILTIKKYVNNSFKKVYYCAYEYDEHNNWIRIGFSDTVKDLDPKACLIRQIYYN